jgi:hypothetical protein
MIECSLCNIHLRSRERQEVVTLWHQLAAPNG